MVLLLDDLILGPGRFMSWIFQQIERMAEEEQQGQAERIKQELAELYNQFETRAINEQEFDTREHELLDRLESLQNGHGKHADSGAQIGQANDQQ